MMCCGSDVKLEARSSQVVVLVEGYVKEKEKTEQRLVPD